MIGQRKHHCMILIYTIIVLSFVPMSVSCADEDDPYLNYYKDRYVYDISSYMESRNIIWVDLEDESFDSSPVCSFDCIDVCVVESIFDQYGGYINVEFSSEEYIIRPSDSLNVYSPFYQLPSSDSDPVCYIEYEVFLDDRPALWGGQDDGLSDDQHSLRLIQSIDLFSQPPFQAGCCCVTVVFRATLFENGTWRSINGELEFSTTVREGRRHFSQ